MCFHVRDSGKDEEVPEEVPEEVSAEVPEEGVGAVMMTVAAVMLTVRDAVCHGAEKIQTDLRAKTDSGAVRWDRAIWDRATWDRAKWDQAIWDRVTWDLAKRDRVRWKLRLHGHDL